jgi:molecular chaperone DnaK
MRQAYPTMLPSALPPSLERAMTHFDFFHDLRKALADRKTAMGAVGIDLGTTKSCTAVARFDPATDQITCECIPYPEPGIPGLPVAVPSVVVVKDGEVTIGHAAKRLVGRKGYTPLRNVFRECKNDIGLRYTYWKAPAGFQSAEEIAGHLAGHLIDASGLAGKGMQAPLLVAVPASFHGAQRTATIAATQRHVNFENSVQLLDEPYAAFLDLVHRQPDVIGSALVRDANVLVFDFGGGTCDVAIFTLAHDTKRGLEPRLRATSRYHRIGGGDIDRAIVHEHLIPMLIEHHGLTPTTFDWQSKRFRIEPQLLPLAERLKLALCRRVAERVAADGKLPDDTVEVVAAGEYEITVGDATYFLESPSLSAKAFRKLLAPYMDPQPPPETSDEYVQHGSVFSPILHALSRAHLQASDIDVLVLAGSSTLIPEVHAAIRAYFSQAQVLGWSDGNELQGAIARGAALQALSLAATGKPLIAPVCSGSLGLQTRQGFLPLVQAGSALPQEATSVVALQAPESSPTRPLELAVEVLTDGNRMLGRSLWTLPAPVVAGEPLELHWSLDANQCISLELQRPGNEQTEPFRHRFDAPVAYLDQGQLVRCGMLEREEALRNGLVIDSKLADAYVAIARDAASLGEHEKALHYLGMALQKQGSSPYLLNLRGLYRERIGDKSGAEASFRLSETSASHFNLASLLYDGGRYDEGLKAIDKSMETPEWRGHAILKAQLLDRLGRSDDAKLIYEDALSGQLNLASMDDWELHWLARGARHLQKNDLVATIATEQLSRREKRVAIARVGCLPDQSQHFDVSPISQQGEAA